MCSTSDDGRTNHASSVPGHRSSLALATAFPRTLCNLTWPILLPRDLTIATYVSRHCVVRFGVISCCFRHFKLRFAAVLVPGAANCGNASVLSARAFIPNCADLTHHRQETLHCSFSHVGRCPPLGTARTLPMSTIVLSLRSSRSRNLAVATRIPHADEFAVSPQMHGDPMAILVRLGDRQYCAIRDGLYSCEV
jgi:hypothetical protein